eukprot:CAMPEP_0202104160 /NCGR_PEP_ID=MMETSP0965-20130614/5309_1 /ASSEMBLY_ACC=CAM_ASM_000507 /TAXON_ID=4773 /ORGANISM="Schizochytrium aggregatum, Strain ATCC28209" /LENGTH=53 /DNA_ID=CAMNT_0048673003 /DNA_START=340 /DNA_END=497 /DNA_ORIENTATION=-
MDAEILRQQLRRTLVSSRRIKDVGLDDDEDGGHGHAGAAAQGGDSRAAARAVS